MIIFIIIGVTVVAFVVIDLFLKPASRAVTMKKIGKQVKREAEQKRYEKVTQQMIEATNKQFNKILMGYQSENRVFLLAQTLSTVYLNPLDIKQEIRKESELEMLIIGLTYVSIYCESQLHLVSDKVDSDIRKELSMFILNSGYSKLIEEEFGYNGVDSFIRKRVLSAREDLKNIHFYNPNFNSDEYFEDSYYPINSFQVIIRAPLHQIKKRDPFGDGYLSKEYSDFKKAFKEYIEGLTKTIQTQVAQQYNFRTNSFSTKVGELQMIMDFNYYPLYEDFCVFCGSFHSREDMLTVEIDDAEVGGGFTGKSCTLCQQKYHSKIVPSD